MFRIYRPGFPAGGGLAINWRQWRNDERNEWPRGTAQEREKFWEHAAAIGVDVAAYRQVLTVEPDPAPAKVKVAPRLTASANIRNAARALQFDPATIQACVDIESGGRGLADDGRPIIRCEAHLLFRAAGGAAPFANCVRIRDLDGDGLLEWNDSHEVRVYEQWMPYHGNQMLEWTALEKSVEACEAAGLDRDIPFRCTSWGAVR